jgi:hypothetical protein
MAKLSEQERQRRALARARRDALAAEEDDHRQSQRTRQWARDGMYLTYEELTAGVACRGCGMVVVDGFGNWPALMTMGATERADYDAADAAFRERHSGCRSSRWSMSGSRSQHCGYCCPPPPMSPTQIDRLRQLFASVNPDPAELDVWKLSLTCDHQVSRHQHCSNQRWSTSVVDCPPCGTARGGVTSERVGPVIVEAERQRS